MIVAMEKLTLLCLEAEREAALERLRDLGVVHLAPVQPPAGDDLEAARRRLEHVRRAIEVLSRPGGTTPDGTENRSAEELIEEIWALIHERQELGERIDLLDQERRRIEPFGDFDPGAAAGLRAAGLRLRLYHADPLAEPVAPAGGVLTTLRRGREGTYLALIGPEESPLEDAEEVRLPERGLGELDRVLAEARERLQAADQRLESLAGSYPVVAGSLREAADRVRFLEAREGMGASGPVAYLSGFLPAGEEARLAAAAREQGWGYRMEEPGPEDQAPSLVVPPRWARPIRAVFEMTGLVPGYDEIDISVPFLIFLSIFFGILVGDAGYGLLFIALTALARRKFPSAPSYPFRLVTIMSVATVVWGALTGTWFGLPRESIPRIPWLDNEDHIMLLCFLLGATHLSVAHAWRAVRLAPSPRALAQIGWIGSTWVMFLGARFFLLGQAFPPWGGWLLGVSMALVIGFSVPPRALKHEGISLAMLPLDVIGNFTDVVSYLRLFAVGTASCAVAFSFNEMVTPLFGSAMGALVGALFLFAGHALNIALCGLGILVHGVRLNTLEFSTHMGMQWTGHPYDPFKREQDGKTTTGEQQ